MLGALRLSWTPAEERTKTAPVAGRGDACGVPQAKGSITVAFVNEPAMTVGRFGEHSPSVR